MNAAREWPADRVERRPLADLIPYARNTRTHTDAQVAQIAASMREWGWTIPCLVDSDGTIIAGHGRVLAAQRLGWTEAPVMVAHGWTPAQVRAYRIADNRLAENSGWNYDLLSAELDELRDIDFDLPLIGFEASDLNDLIGTPNVAPETEHDEDAVPEVDDALVSVAGDIWRCGPHRLICGDSTDPQTIAALMRGEAAPLCFTSPPYLNHRDYETPVMQWDALMRGVFANIPMTTDGQVLVNLGLIHRNGELLLYWNDWCEWMRSQGWRRFGQYVWDQGPGMPGDYHGRLAPAFEFVFHFNRESRGPNKIIPCKHAGEFSHSSRRSPSGTRNKNGSIDSWHAADEATQETRIPDSVIRITRYKAGAADRIDHPAMFPVALAQFVIESYSNAGETVFEPFSGSGTVLIAAEKTKREARCVEIAPVYVDVAVRRWQEFAGDAAVLEGDGRTFDEIAAERASSPLETRDGVNGRLDNSTT